MRDRGFRRGPSWQAVRDTADCGCSDNFDRAHILRVGLAWPRGGHTSRVRIWGGHTVINEMKPQNSGSARARLHFEAITNK